MLNKYGLFEINLTGFLKCKIMSCCETFILFSFIYTNDVKDKGKKRSKTIRKLESLICIMMIRASIYNFRIKKATHFFLYTVNMKQSVMTRSSEDYKTSKKTGNGKPVLKYL